MAPPSPLSPTSSWAGRSLNLFSGLLTRLDLLRSKVLLESVRHTTICSQGNCFPLHKSGLQSLRLAKSNQQICDQFYWRGESFHETWSGSSWSVAYLRGECVLITQHVNHHREEAGEMYVYPLH